MLENRKEIEDKILKIITYIEQHTLEFPLKQNIKLFSLKELKQLLEFLESWDLTPLYHLLDEKIKEYKWIMEEIKMIKIWKKKKIKQLMEESEHKKEEEEAEKLINF